MVEVFLSWQADVLKHQALLAEQGLDEASLNKLQEALDAALDVANGLASGSVEQRRCCLP